MRLYRILLLTLVTLVSSCPLWAAAPEDGPAVRLGLAAGYRSDNLDWNIAGDTSGQNPNILSELTWSDLRIYQMQADMELQVPFGHSGIGLLVVGDLGGGVIVAGDNQDSDYAGDNRTLEFSRSNNAADSGWVFDTTVGAGPCFRNTGGTLYVAPMIGLALHTQQLEITDGYQTVSGAVGVPPVGPFDGLDSSYDAYWSSVWLGARLGVDQGRLHLRADGRAHLASYYGEGDWNLRADLQHPTSFEHDATGWGLTLQAAAEVDLNTQWRLGIEGRYQNWRATDGDDTTFFANSSVGLTRFNEVNWDSWSLMLRSSFRF